MHAEFRYFPYLVRSLPHVTTSYLFHSLCCYLRGLCLIPECLFRLWPIFITFSSECTWCLVRLDERGTFDLHFRSHSARGLTYFFGFFAPEISTNTIASSDLWMAHKFRICVFVSSVEFNWLSWHKIEFWSFGRYIDRVNFCGTMSQLHTDPE